MTVKRGYSFVSKRGAVFGEYALVQIDDENKHDKGQMWKLEKLKSEVPVTTAPPKRKKDPVAEAKNLIDELGPLIENEPPKVIVDPNAKKPAQDIPKEKAETMLDRVKQFVEKQEQENKK
jgi:hypothetical protein